MDETETEFRKRDSIELKRSAKGEHFWNIKLYFDIDTQGYRDTVDDLKAIHESLKERFL